VGKAAFDKIVLVVVEADKMALLVVVDKVVSKIVVLVAGNLSGAVVDSLNGVVVYSFELNVVVYNLVLVVLDAGRRGALLLKHSPLVLTKRLNR
jgi:hypothetical protein